MLRAPREKRPGQPLAAADYNKLQGLAQAVAIANGARGSNVAMSVGSQGLQVQARQARKGPTSGAIVLGATDGAQLPAYSLAEITNVGAGATGSLFPSAPCVAIGKPTTESPRMWCVTGGASIGLRGVAQVLLSGPTPCWLVRPTGEEGARAHPTVGQTHATAGADGAPILWEEDVADKTQPHQAVILLGAPRRGDTWEVRLEGYVRLGGVTPPNNAAIGYGLGTDYQAGAAPANKAITASYIYLADGDTRLVQAKATIAGARTFAGNTLTFYPYTSTAAAAKAGPAITFTNQTPGAPVCTLDGTVPNSTDTSDPLNIPLTAEQGLIFVVENNGIDLGGYTGQRVLVTATLKRED